MVQGQLNFRVEGKIEGVVHSMIYLADHEGVKVDSVRSPDGNFAFTRNITEPLMFGINVENIAGRIQFFGVSGKINLSAEINDANKKFKNIIVTGSHEHDLYRRLVAAEKGGYTPDELQKVRELQKNNDTTALRLLKEKKMKEMENSFLEIRLSCGLKPNYQNVVLIKDTVIHWLFCQQLTLNVWYQLFKLMPFLTSSPLETPGRLQFIFNIISSSKGEGRHIDRLGVCTGWLSDIVRPLLIPSESLEDQLSGCIISDHFVQVIYQ